MPILGHGIDLVPVPRIARSLEQHGQRFEQRVFTEAELAYARDRKRRTEHLAARFAAKEAVLKALGTGWRSGIAWTDVEVVLAPSGQPTVQLHGEAARVAHDMGVREWHLSLSHTEEHATASAIAEG